MMTDNQVVKWLKEFGMLVNMPTGEKGQGSV
jgi:hypothetical protein